MQRFCAALREQLARPEERLELFDTALVMLAGVARAGELPAEQFVVLVKQQWQSVLERERNTDYDGAVYQRLRQSVVTAAIKAYYMQ